MGHKKKKSKLRIDRVIIVLAIVVTLLFGLYKGGQFVVAKITSLFETKEEVPTTQKEPKQPEVKYNGIVVIDPGHGGEDAGTNKDGVLEKNITLKVAKVVGEELSKNKIKVIYTRTTDVSLNPIKRLDLKMRGAVATDNNADYFVSIHVNAFEESSDISGFELYKKDNNDPLINEKSDSLARLIATQVEGLKYSENRGIQSGKSLSVLRDNAVAGALIELGYLNNPSDYKYLNDSKKLDALGRAIAKGILNQIELK